MRGFSGTVGKQLVLRNRAGKTILANRPVVNKNRIPTPQQEAVRLRFRESVVYAKTTMQDPALKLDYAAAARPGQSHYNVAFTDAYLPPVISNLQTDQYTGKPGDKIMVRVMDDFYVDKVQVSITAGGVVLEFGDAVPESNGLDWSYTITEANASLPGTVVKVSAEDLPKNRSILEKTL